MTSARTSAELPVCAVCGIRPATSRTASTCGRSCRYALRESRRLPASQRTAHGTHHHRTYGLDCDAFDALIARAAGRCERCQKELPSPVIDHEHSTGEIRGLLCRPCNRHLGFVDAGQKELDRLTASYLHAARLRLTAGVFA